MSMVRKAVTGAAAGAELLFSRGGKQYGYATSGMHKGEIAGVRDNLLGRLSDSGDAFGQRTFDRLMQSGTISLKPAMGGAPAAAAAAPAAAPIRGGGSPVSKAVQLVGGGPSSTGVQLVGGGGGGAGGSLVPRRGGGAGELVPHRGGELVPRGRTATPVQVEEFYDPRTITSGADPGYSFGSGYAASTFVGGMYGAMMADPDQRLEGAALGAFGAGVTGKAFKTFSRKGASMSNSIYTGLDSKIGGNAKWGPMNRAWNKHKNVVHKGLRGFHSTQGRHNMFRSGAMLGGGAFGAMFASNGRSHKRGFNSQRGNSISR